MPYSTSDTSRYPVYIVSIWAAALRNRSHTIPCSDYKQASKIRLQLNSYRVACRNTKSPLSPQYDAIEVLIRPTKPNNVDKAASHTVHLQSIDDSELAKVLEASLAGIDLGNNAPPALDIEFETNPDTSLPGEIKEGKSVF